MVSLEDQELLPHMSSGNQRAALRLKGLYELYNCFETLNIEVFLTDGSLLGAVRDGELIPWDWDHELTIMRNEFCKNFSEIIKEVKKVGFKVHYFDSDYRNLKLNLMRYGEKYCIIVLYETSMFYKRQNYKYPKAFLIRSLT